MCVLACCVNDATRLLAAITYQIFRIDMIFRSLLWSRFENTTLYDHAEFIRLSINGIAVQQNRFDPNVGYSKRRGRYSANSFECYFPPFYCCALAIIIRNNNNNFNPFSIKYYNFVLELQIIRTTRFLKSLRITATLL